MGYLLNDAHNDQAMDALTQEAKHAIAVAVPLDQSGNPVELWAPERLRLDAMVRFLRGDYAGSAASLEVALAGYEAIQEQAALATASCMGERADAVFYIEPLRTERAVSLARSAIERAPGGRLGKELVAGIRIRLVDYYLAGGQEEEAKQVLAATAPPGTIDKAMQYELAVRYRRLCESMKAPTTCASGAATRSPMSGSRPCRPRRCA